MSELRYEVLVNDGLRRNRDQRLPDGSPIISSPVATTLIYGERDAVLVDPPFTREQVGRVGDWIERSGKHLTAVYATHGHGDHWFGTDLLLQRFPDAHAYATDGTIAMMHKQGTEGRAQMWDVDFPGLIPPSPVVYRPIPADGIELEGHRLLAVEVGHTDTDDTTVLHVPSIGLVVPDDPAIIAQTREYLLNARRLLAETLTPREYFDQMITLYPDRLNVGPVWYTAVALLPEPPSDSSVRDEVTHWFFDDYLTTWIGVGAGTIKRGPEFILDYWSAPLNWSEDQGSRWILEPADVVAVLQQLQTRLRNEGYAHTAVPDQKVTVYHDNG